MIQFHQKFMQNINAYVVSLSTLMQIKVPIKPELTVTITIKTKIPRRGQVQHEILTITYYNNCICSPSVADSRVGTQGKHSNSQMAQSG